MTFKRFLLLFPFLFLTTILANNEDEEDPTHKTLYWPSGSGAPYSKLTFSQPICNCPHSDFNMTKFGCLNVTDGVITDFHCIEKPYWGLVFVWWGVAAFLIGGVTTTCFGIISDIWNVIWLYGLQHRKNPNINQVVDINWKK